MVNVSKIRLICAEKGIKLSFLIEQLGLKSRTYFQDIEKRHADISEERLVRIAELLGTTTEYLRDESDDPSPKQKKPAAISDELWRKINEDPDGLLILEMLYNLDEERRSELKAILAERFSK